MAHKFTRVNSRSWHQVRAVPRCGKPSDQPWSHAALPDVRPHRFDASQSLQRADPLDPRHPRGSPPVQQARLVRVGAHELGDIADLGVASDADDGQVFCVRASSITNDRIFLGVEDLPVARGAIRPAGHNGEAGLAHEPALALADLVRAARGDVHTTATTPRCGARTRKHTLRRAVRAARTRFRAGTASLRPVRSLSPPGLKLAHARRPCSSSRSWLKHAPGSQEPRPHRHLGDFRLRHAHPLQSKPPKAHRRGITIRLSTRSPAPWEWMEIAERQVSRYGS